MEVAEVVLQTHVSIDHFFGGCGCYGLYRKGFMARSGVVLLTSSSWLSTRPRHRSSLRLLSGPHIERCHVLLGWELSVAGVWLLWFYTHVG